MFHRKKSPNIFFDDLELKAKKILPKSIYDHIAGGAGDELTLNQNKLAFSEIALIPHVLQNVDKIDTSISLFGTKYESPIIIAPTSFHGLVSSEKEIGTAMAAQEVGCIMSVSMMSNSTLEDIARSGSSLWFQLHINSDHSFTEKLVKRAENSGYKAIIVTVDIPQMGKRNRDIKNEFKLPISCTPANFVDSSNKVNIKEIQFNPSTTWEDIQWIKSITKLPILLKGILNPSDALKALDCRVDGIIISNHGGRQLDGAVATIKTLPGIASVIKNRLPIFIDGGIRSGTDIVKAIALGADAVLIGRPVLWGLAVAGGQGVVQVLKTLTQELILAMQLVGCHSIDDLKHKKIIFPFASLSSSDIKSLREEIAKISREQAEVVHSMVGSLGAKIKAKL